MDVVSFTRMADGTKEDYEFLHEQEQLFMPDLPVRLRGKQIGAFTAVRYPCTPRRRIGGVGRCCPAS